MYEEFKNHDVAVYGGYLQDTSKLMESSSGGVATALSEYMLNLGGYIAGVVYSEDLYTAKYILTDNKSDIQLLKGSKYIECDTIIKVL